MPPPILRIRLLTVGLTGYATQRHAGGGAIPAVRMAKAFVARTHAILNKLAYQSHLNLTN
eukprot:6201738-Pleurochrysis_carterae.AAC.3